MKRDWLNVTLAITALLLAFATIGCGSEDDPITDDEAVNDTAATGDDEVNDEGGGAVCGNKIVEAGEQCDGVLKKCIDVDPGLYEGGNALCNIDCMWDLSGCVEKEETPDYDYAQPDLGQPDSDTDPGDVTSGFANNPDCQCSVDRNDVCTKADYDAWTGAPMPAPQNGNVRRLCIGGVWLWAPFSAAATAGECVESLCLPGEARQFLQAGANGFCVCLNKCTLQGDQAENKPCGTGRTCIAIDDATGTQVHVCGGHQ